MKCKVCGKRANSIGAMAKHYRQKHPSKMKRKSHKVISGKKMERFLHPIQHKPGITKEIFHEAQLIKGLSDMDKNYLILHYVPYGVLLKIVRGY